MPLGAFLRRILFYAPGTAEPSGYAPAELVVYEFEFNLPVFEFVRKLGKAVDRRQYFKERDVSFRWKQVRQWFAVFVLLSWFSVNWNFAK